MQTLNKNEQKLAKQLEKQEGISLQKYQKRFEGTKPLKLWSTNVGYISDLPVEVECPKDLIHQLSNKFQRKKLELFSKIIIGFKKKIIKDQVLQLEYIDTNTLGVGKIFKKNVIDIMQKICPDDFEPVPVTLVSLNKHVEPFEIKDFYSLNVLKCIKAVDEERSIIDWSENGMAYIKKLRYKENPWQDGCIPISGRDSPKDSSQYPQHELDKPCMLAIDALSGAIVWHPALAKLMPAHPYYFFITDAEQNKLKGIKE